MSRHIPTLSLSSYNRIDVFGSRYLGIGDRNYSSGKVL